MSTHPVLQRLGHEIRRTAIALGFYLGGLAFLAIITVKFVPALLKDVAATQASWIDVASSQTTGQSLPDGRIEPAALPLHGSIEPVGGRKREPHMLPD
jgi:hypothetical protein